MKQAAIISGFLGVGKTSMRVAHPELRILDSDSTDFSWADASKKVRHVEWPDNYVRHVRENVDFADVICVSSHDVVRAALVRDDLRFVLVYPRIEMRDEYIKRYVDRGSNAAFVELLSNN